MECHRQLNDPAVCHCTDDRLVDCSVQKALLQDHQWLADYVVTDVAVPVLLFVYRVSITSFKHHSQK